MTKRPSLASLNGVAPASMLRPCHSLRGPCEASHSVQECQKFEDRSSNNAMNQPGLPPKLPISNCTCDRASQSPVTKPNSMSKCPCWSSHLPSKHTDITRQTSFIPVPCSATLSRLRRRSPNRALPAFADVIFVVAASIWFATIDPVPTAAYVGLVPLASTLPEMSPVLVLSLGVSTTTKVEGMEVVGFEVSLE